MLNVTTKIISLLKGDATLTSTVPANNIMTGPVDIVQNTQDELTMPQINVQLVSESSRTVPSGVRDINMQLDIWTRNSQLELENIYERVVTLIDGMNTDNSGTHIFWSNMTTANDQYESDRRIWHRSVRFMIWAN